MKARFLVGGGVVLIAAVAIAYWLGDEPQPGPTAPTPSTGAPTAQVEPELEPELEPESEIEPEPEIEPESEIGPEPAVQTEPVIDAEPAIDAELEAEVEFEPETAEALDADRDQSTVPGAVAAGAIEEMPDSESQPVAESPDAPAAADQTVGVAGAEAAGPLSNVGAGLPPADDTPATVAHSLDADAEDADAEDGVAEDAVAGTSTAAVPEAAAPPSAAEAGLSAGDGVPEVEPMPAGTGVSVPEQAADAPMPDAEIQTAVGPTAAEPDLVPPLETGPAALPSENAADPDQPAAVLPAPPETVAPINTPPAQGVIDEPAAAAASDDGPDGDAASAVSPSEPAEPVTVAPDVSIGVIEESEIATGSLEADSQPETDGAMAAAPTAGTDDVPSAVLGQTTVAPPRSVTTPEETGVADEQGADIVASAPTTVPSSPGQAAGDGAIEPAAVVPSEPTPDVVDLAAGQPAPSFDAVRVNDSGMIIVAGRAAPGATVVITDNGAVIGTVQADALGEFVFIGSQPLGPGDHEIGLDAAQDGDADSATQSSQVVLLVVPEPGLTVADTALAEDGGGGALAILVDRDEIAPTEVLQAPVAPAAPAHTGAADLVAPEPPAAIVDTTDSPAVERPVAVDAVPDAETASTRLAVSIDVVDYDDDGRLIVAGRALPNSVIIIYLNNQPVGRAVTAADGRYWLRPDQPVAPGLYTLRADQVAADGSVVARAETPFQRTAPIAGLPANRQVVVQPGNNLWRLARRIYGQGLQYTVIYQANRNQIRDPDLIYPGQIFELPAPPERLPAGPSSRS